MGAKQYVAVLETDVVLLHRSFLSSHAMMVILEGRPPELATAQGDPTLEILRANSKTSCVVSKGKQAVKLTVWLSKVSRQ